MGRLGALRRQHVWLRHVQGSHRSFFSREANLLQCAGDGAVTNLSIPKLRHLNLGLIAMDFNKRPKLRPIGNFAIFVGGWPGLWFDVSSVCPALEPQVDSVATDIEQIADFGFGKTIKFNRLENFLAEIVTVGFAQERSPRDSLSF